MDEDDEEDEDLDEDDADKYVSRFWVVLIAALYCWIACRDRKTGSSSLLLAASPSVSASLAVFRMASIPSRYDPSGPRPHGIEPPPPPDREEEEEGPRFFVCRGGNDDDNCGCGCGRRCGGVFGSSSFGFLLRSSSSTSSTSLSPVSSSFISLDDDRLSK